MQSSGHRPTTNYSTEKHEREGNQQDRNTSAGRTPFVCVRPSTCHMIWRCLCVWTNMAGNHKFNNCGVNKCREPIPNKDQFKARFPQRVIRPGAPRLQHPHPPPSRSLSVHLMVVKWLKLSWVLWTHFFSEDFNLASSGTAQHLRTLSSGLSIAGCWAEGGGRSFL